MILCGNFNQHLILFIEIFNLTFQVIKEIAFKV